MPGCDGVDDLTIGEDITVSMEMRLQVADDHSKAWRAIRAYSAKRARRDQKTLHTQEVRAKAIISGERKAYDPLEFDDDLDEWT